MEEKMENLILFKGFSLNLSRIEGKIKNNQVFINIEDFILGKNSFPSSDGNNYNLNIIDIINVNNLLRNKGLLNRSNCW